MRLGRNPVSTTWQTPFHELSIALLSEPETGALARELPASFAASRQTLRRYWGDDLVRTEARRNHLTGDKLLAAAIQHHRPNGEQSLKKSSRLPMNPSSRLIIFAKSPEPGRAKTRLIPALGPEGAARCAAALVRHTLRTAVAAEIGKIELWCTPDCDHPFFAACRREFGPRLKRQRGNDLGERMYHAFATSLADGGHALLMGTDCPTLLPADLQEAAALLHRGHDAVLVPAFDGGYVLIGLRCVRPELFSEIAWGTKRVLSQTRAKFRTLGYQWRELPPRFDVDHPKDWNRLVAEHPEWLSLLAGRPMA